MVQNTIPSPPNPNPRSNQPYLLFEPKYSDWKEWFAWRPVKMRDESWCWFRKIYWRYGSRAGRYWTEYGTIFDMLASA